MGSFKFYATLAGLLAVASSAQAADLLPPPPPPPVPVDVGGGWYLRGDVGVSHYESSGFRTPTTVATTFYGEDVGSGAFAGIGAGYQWNSWFRTDVTGEYRFSTGFRGFDRATYFGGKSDEINQGNYWGAVGLVNAYFDLGTWYGVTPFVGGGVGVAYNNLSGWYDQSYNTVFNGTPFPPTYPSGGTIRNQDRFNFAWALYAGLGYDVTPNLKLEIGYRYLNLGDMRTGVVDCFCGETYTGVKVRDVEAHEVKIGMRWLLGGPVYAEAPVPYAPIVRKY